MHAATAGTAGCQGGLTSAAPTPSLLLLLLLLLLQG
jgi:hypothetical protein